MDAVERFTTELYTLLSDIAFSGIKNVHSGVLTKLEAIKAAAVELGMSKGAELLSEFSDALGNYRTNEEDAERVLALLSGLAFYNENLTGNRQAQDR
jgi:hypothetical protein